MRPVTDLSKLYEAFTYRLLRIRRVFGLAATLTEPRRSEFIAVSVIELDNLIIGALRAFTISSLRGGRTSQRHRVVTSRTFGREEEIAAYVLSVLDVATYRRLRTPTQVSRREEPKVRDPRSTERVFARCGASNIGSLQNALALNSRVFSELAPLRNFYAHRNDDTWRKVRNRAQAMGIFNAAHPNDVVTYVLPGRPVNLFEDWLDDVELFFDEATK